jgi:hypothetical protein
MSKHFVVLCGLAASLAGGCGERSTTPAPVSSAGGDAAAMVTQLEREWVNAIVQKDVATIERLLAPDFTGTTGDVRYGKAEAINDVKTGLHSTLDIEDVDARAYGDDTVVVTFDQQERSKHGDEDFSGHYLFTNVWVKQGGHWVAVASHGNRIR